MSRRPILLLVNPTAGGKLGSGPGLADNSADLEPAALAAALRDHGLEVVTHELAEDDDVTALAAGAARDGRDVVVGGGDGTVSAAATGLVETDATLGILAMGSFNNVARGLGVPRHLPEAIEAIVRGRSDSVDVGFARRGDGDPVYFFESGGVGMDAELFLAAEAGQQQGLRVALSRAWRALRGRRQPLRLVVDERTLATSALFVTVSNGPYYGWGFTIAADADVTDGQMEVSIFSRMSTWATIRHFLSVARGRHRYEPRIRRLRAHRIAIEARRRALPTHVDGRPLGPTPITFEAIQGGLRVYRDPELAQRAAEVIGEE